MRKTQSIFLTGATGFVGAHLALKLLEEGDKLILLVRDKKEPAEERVKRAFAKICGSTKRFKSLRHNIEVINGDLTKGNLGISQQKLAELKSKVDIVFHCAANTNFDESLKEQIERDNVTGTKNVLDFTLKLQNQDFHYISTAYVCGQRKGIVYEDDLDKGQKFNNPYEESKFKSELLVREFSAQYNLRSTIYRPAIIVGDSRNGKALNFFGFYTLVKALYVLANIFKEDLKRGGKRAESAGVFYRGKWLHLPLRVPAIANKTLNIVTIDYVINVILRIFSRAHYHGRVYHIVNPTPPTIGHIKNLICITLNLSGVKIIDPKEFNNFSVYPYEKIFLESIKWYTPYLQKEGPIFSDRNTQEILNGALSSCSHFTLDLVRGLITYCIATDWGRKDKYLGDPPSNFSYFVLDNACLVMRRYDG